MGSEKMYIVTSSLSEHFPVWELRGRLGMSSNSVQAVYDFLSRRDKERQNQVKESSLSEIWERLYDGLVGRRRRRGEPQGQAAAGPAEIGAPQAVSGEAGGGGRGSGERHHLTVSLHGKRWALQKRMERGSPEA